MVAFSVLLPVRLIDYGLRDYGTAKWEGGDPNCDHRHPIDCGHNAVVWNTIKGVQRPYKDVCAKCGAIRIDQQIGLEQTPDEYVANMVQVFREVRRVLRDDGTCWLNLGDSYGGGSGCHSGGSEKQRSNIGATNSYIPSKNGGGIKPKDLIGIPWRVAFALQADGWYLRQDIIWCLSGGAYVYAKTQKGVLPMMVRDIYRLNPTTVKLWNGEKWTQLLGINKSHRRGDELEIVLRSGERISCTPTHKFPTDRGLLMASELKVGDKLIRTQLPDNEYPRDCAIDTEAAWFAGLYLAEGSRSDDCIQIAGHSKEVERLDRVQRIAEKYGGSATYTITGNMMNIRVYGRVLIAILDELVTGRTAKDKGFAPAVWKYSNEFIASMIDGYLSGDGHFDGKRWRLGFTRNYNLERDLRTACARLGYHLILNLSTVKYNGKDVPTFRGELRKQRSGHRNEKNEAEIVEIRRSRCREVYDLGVEDEPHLFALASGILTHNSKPNPMPESVKDRCTKAHEYIFLLTKSARYYFDNEAIKEPAVTSPDDKSAHRFGAPNGKVASTPGKKHIESGKKWQMKYKNLQADSQQPNTMHLNSLEGEEYMSPVRNKRSVWTVTTKPYKGAHYATFPPDLIKPMILAGCPPGGIVLDPFAGSGTTVMVAIQLGREGIGLDLSASYLHEQAKKRIATVQGVLV